MNKNYYWPVYQNLEKALLELSDQIHVDDRQLDVYSVKISELLIRSVVEIEALSKELYFREGGTLPDDKNLFFDTDCIELLESKWMLSKKCLLVTGTSFYLENEENKILFPLKKANKRGTSSSKWLQAYQGVKHNRIKSLNSGNLRNLINALGALFILNLYYMDIELNLGKDPHGLSFDSTQTSMIFSIETFKVNFDYIEKSQKNDLKYQNSLFIIYPEQSSLQRMKIVNQEVNEEIQKRIFQVLHSEGYLQRIQELYSLPNSLEKENLIKKENYLKDLRVNELGNYFRNDVLREFGHKLYNTMNEIVYYAVINKNQK